MLPLARTPVLSASDGCFGLKCVGDRCFSVRWCRLGPTLSWLECWSSEGEAVASSSGISPFDPIPNSPSRQKDLRGLCLESPVPQWRYRFLVTLVQESDAIQYFGGDLVMCI